jgi:transposase-like protein
MSMKKNPSRRPSGFSPEFHRDAVSWSSTRNVRVPDVARSVGVNEGTWGTGFAWNASSAVSARG